MSTAGERESVRAGRLASVLEEYLGRLERGGTEDVEGFVAGHPELAEDLRDALESLRFIARVSLPASHRLSSAGIEPAIGAERRLGDFRILREVGRGGMGIVYEAIQVSLDRRVALKILPFASVLDPRQLQRFRNEALAAAQLHHTNIVPVYSTGCENGVHYYSMQFIDGEPLSRALAELRRARRGALGDGGDAAAPASGSPVSSQPSTTSPDWYRLVARLGRSAAEALAYAHQVGVVHRDVKPANLLVDRASNLWVADFGLARMAAGADLTTPGDLLGTLRYMSPEQARRLPADHRTDVYSLGATLYELAGLEPAFPGDDPKAVLAAILATDPPPLRRRIPSVPADLETVISKAMAKDPGARYATAQDMADDLGRFLEGRPILAKRPSAAQRTAMWARRHRPLVAAGAAGGLLLVLGLAAGTVMIAQEQGRTESALNSARAERAAADEARDRARARGLVNASIEAGTTDPVLALLLARASLRVARTPDTIAALRGALALARERTRIPGDVAPLASAAFSPRGDRVLTIGTVGTARLWDMRGRVAAVIPGDVVAGEFSPSGDRVLTVSGDKGARIWDAAGSLVTVLRGHEAAVTAASFSPSGDRCLTASEDGTARLFDLSGATLAVAKGHDGPMRAARFARSGTRIVTTAEDGRVRIWDSAGHEIAALETAEARGRFAIVSPDGERILTASGSDPTARLWDADGREVCVLKGHEAPLTHAAFDRSGAYVVTTSVDRTARLWDAQGALLAVCRGHAESVTSVAFSPTGESFATASPDHTARLWDLHGNEVAVLRGHDGLVTSVSFSPAGDLLLTSSVDRTARIWDVGDVEPVGLKGHRGRIVAASFSPAGDRLLTASEDGTARLWDRSGAPLAVLEGHTRGLSSAAFSPSGARIVTTSADRTARVWSASGAPLAVLSGHEDAVVCAAFSPSEGAVLTGSADGTARLFDESGAEKAVLRGHRGQVLSVAFLGHEERLLTAAQDGTARLWSAAGAPLGVISSPDGPMSAAASAGGDRIATIAALGPARLWTGTGRAITALRGGDAIPWAAAWSRDGRLLLTVGGDRMARLWNAEGEAVAILSGHALGVNSALFAPGGDRILTASDDGTARVWDLHGHEEDVLRGPGDAMVAASCAPGGDGFLTLGRTSGCYLWRSRLEDLERIAEPRICRDFTRTEREKYRDLLGPENDLAIRAQARVDSLFDILVLAADVREGIRADTSMPDDLRQEALRIAADRVDDPDRLNRDAWAVVRRPGCDAYDYGRALHVAKAVVRLWPGNADALNTLGAAEYRAGNMEEAVHALDLAIESRAVSHRDPAPEDLAFLLMAHHRSGRPEVARRHLERLRAIMASPAQAENRGGRTFLAEAEAVVGSVPAPAAAAGR